MSKIKLVPVTNMTKYEINLAIMEGRRFALESDINLITEEDDVIHWDANFGYNPIRHGQNHWNWRGLKNLHELVEQQWYEDPDMVGKPVKVRNDEDGDWVLAIFKGYDEGSGYPFDVVDSAYKYAEPLTAADLYQEQV